MSGGRPVSRDNERTIDACLESIQTWVDEVIVAIRGPPTGRRKSCSVSAQGDFSFRGATTFRRPQAVAEAGATGVVLLD